LQRNQTHGVEAVAVGRFVFTYINMVIGMKQLKRASRAELSRSVYWG
jgi:hypothetical protein